MSVVPLAQRAELHVSVSQVKTWLMCPRKYELRYVLGAQPEHRSVNLVLGRAVHEALAQYYLGLRSGGALDAEQLALAFREAWANEADGEPPLLLPDGTTEEDLLEQGVQLLSAFFVQHVPPTQVLAVEQPFALDIYDPVTGVVLEEQLVGTLDALVRDDEGDLVLEHKTSARRWSQDQLDFDLQATVYLAVTDLARLRFQVLLKQKVPGLATYDVTRSEAARTEAFIILCRVLDAIRAGIFWPNRGWMCRVCEFRRQCGP